LVRKDILLTDYNNTGRSILAVLLLHTTGNLSHFTFLVGATTWSGLYSVILNVVVVIIILIIWGPKRMVRNSIKAITVETGHSTC